MTDSDHLRAMADDIRRRSTREALALLRGADALDKEPKKDACARCGRPYSQHPVVYVGDGSAPPQIQCYTFETQP